MANRILTQQTSTGEPVAVSNFKVYPVAHSYQVKMPGANGGIIWNRPVAVIVEDSEGNKQVLPVTDVTRWLQVAIVAAGFFGVILSWLIFRKSSKPAD